MKKKLTPIRITPSGEVQLHNNESAMQGEASTLSNMREREQSLEAVGIPATIATMAVNEKLLYIDDKRIIKLAGNDITCDGKTIATTSDAITSVQAVGNFIIITTDKENIYLRRTDDSYARLTPDDAIPSLHLSATDESKYTTDINPYTFETPYSTWQAPISNNDATAISSVVRKAWRTLTADIADHGRYSRPILARYAVRLWDDSYLWTSAPVLLGTSTIATNRASTEVATSDGKYAGIQATTLTLNSYRVGITVLKGVANEWRDLVKSIDILTTDEADTVKLNSALDYRCAISTSSGTRRYIFEFGPAQRDKASIFASLTASGWKLAATTTHIGELSSNKFATMNVTNSTQNIFPGTTSQVITSLPITDTTLRNSELSQLTSNISHIAVPTCTMSHNGRWYRGGMTCTCYNPWSTLQSLAGTITAGTCEVQTVVTLATSHGEATIVSDEMLSYTPSKLNALLSYPDTRATSMAIKVKGAGNVLTLQYQLSPLYDSGIACSVNANLTENTLSDSGSNVITVATSTNNTDYLPGTIAVSCIGNPFVTAQSHEVSGATIKALAVAERPIYSGGFGRYPIYVFTTDGIFALPQQTNGSYGEPRIIGDSIIADGTKPVNGNRDVWYLSQLATLCSVSGTTIKTHLCGIRATQLAWNNAENELWTAGNGSCITLMPSGRTFSRDLPVSSLYNFGNQAVAVTDTGNILDLKQEEKATMQISYLSHPIAIAELMDVPLKRIAWKIFSNEATLRLTIYGERGRNCHGFIINRFNVKGAINAPISAMLITQPVRIVRLEVTGSVPTGTLLLPVTIFK